MLVPYVNTNTAKEVILVTVSAKEFARLIYIRNDSFTILYIPTYVDKEAKYAAALQKAIKDVIGPYLITPPLELVAIS